MVSIDYSRSVPDPDLGMRTVEIRTTALTPENPPKSVADILRAGGYTEPATDDPACALYSAPTTITGDASEHAEVLDVSDHFLRELRLLML